MWRSRLLTALCLVLLAQLAYPKDAGPVLMPVELKWLRAAWPVVNFAEAQQLPLDIIVQPATTNGTAPFSMSVADGRCKLVLSMRSDPDAESILASLPAELHAIAVEAITAHELAHCWRYLNGMWHTLPAGFIETGHISDPDSSLAALQEDMRQTRREEGFADLVGLAWTLRAHPQQYAAIHAWFEHIRADQPIAGSFHDTRRWLQLAARPEAFPDAVTPFEQARQVWSRGLPVP